jgi:hypothetical protein
LLTDDLAPCHLTYKLEGHPPQAIGLGNRADWKLALDTVAVYVLELFENGKTSCAQRQTQAWRDLIADHTVVTQDQTKAVMRARWHHGRYYLGISFPGSPANGGNCREPRWVDERGVPIDALDRWWLDEIVLDHSTYGMKDSKREIQREPLFHTLVLTSYMRLMLRHFPGVGFGFICEPYTGDSDDSPKWQPDRTLTLRWHLANPSTKSKYQGLEVTVRPPESLRQNASDLWNGCTDSTYCEFRYRHEALWYCWAESIIELLHQLPARPLASCFSLQQQVRVLDSLWQAASTVKRILSRFDWKVNRILIQ